MGGFRGDLSQVVHVPIPAAGVGFTHRLAGSEYSRLRTVSFALTTSATVANRTVRLSLQHGNGGVIATIPAPAVQTAGQTDTYTFGVGLWPYADSASSAVVAPLPDLWLSLGDRIVVSVASIDTTDAITKIYVVLDQVPWLEAQGE